MTYFHGYEAEFKQGLLKADEKHFIQKFNFTVRYIDDAKSLNNLKISEDIEFIYPCEFGIKDTTESKTSASY